LQYDFVVAITGLAQPQAFIVTSHDIIEVKEYVWIHQDGYKN
jgi:hypothetical protein